VKNHLLTLWPWDGGADAVVDPPLRFAVIDHETGAGHTPANAYYEGVLLGFSLSRAAVRLDGGLAGQSAPAGGAATIGVPQDWKASRLAAIKGYGYDGRAFELRELPDGVVDPASGTVVASGFMSDLVQTGADELSLSFHDRSLDLRKTMQTAFFAGTGGVEG